MPDEVPVNERALNNVLGWISGDGDSNLVGGELSYTNDGNVSLAYTLDHFIAEVGIECAPSPVANR